MQLSRGVFHLDISSFVGSGSSGFSVFCGEFIAEEVEVGDKEYPLWLIYRCTLTFLNISLQSLSLMKLFSGKKQNFCSWDYSSPALDYQDFQIIRRWIEEILLYCFFHILMAYGVMES